MSGVEREAASVRQAARRMEIFVLLGHGFGARRWRERWVRGEIPGIVEEMPYGYFHCAGDDCQIEHSEDASEAPLMRLARMGVRRLLGFDPIHVWRNRAGIEAADIIWTHTEYEYLAVLLLFRFGLARKRKPKLIAQSIWLFDRWRDISRLKRWAYRRLIERADILTMLSPDNLRIAADLFPGKLAEFVPFGIDARKMLPARSAKFRSPVRVLSLGNDPHRDWDVLIRALGGRGEYHIRVGGYRVGRLFQGASRGVSNLEIVKPASAAEIERLYEWADIAVVPLKRNFHVSGITAIMEAILLGIPVVCTDTGGLRAYFSEREVSYTPLGEAELLRRAVEHLAHDERRRFAMARRAQARIVNSNLNSRTFARRHYELSRALLERQTFIAPDQKH